MLDTWALNQRRLKKRLYFRLIESRTLRSASSIHAVSETEIEDIRRLAISTEVVHVPNGINQADFEHLPDRNIFREKHPAVAKKTIVLFLGRVHPKKGIALLAKAFSDLAGAQPDLALVVVGPDSGGCQRELEDCMNASGAAGSYVFTGLLGREECIEALAAADIFVLPSSSEGLPIAAMEALAAGLPVILTKACNLQEVEENGAGMIIEQDADALRQAIVTLAGDQATRKEMGRKGREFALTHYTWDRIAARMVNVYESILSNHKPVLA
jgi:glycosyltransferase involved in cell wall biosynthesis